MDRFILAHDLGTSGDKATLFSERGTLVDSATVTYQTRFGNAGEAEQDAGDWWRAATAAARELASRNDLSRVAAIAVSGHMMGCLCVDRSGTPLRPHMLYCDSRAQAEAEEFGGRAGADEVYRLTGNRASAAYTGPKLRWIKEREPDVYRRTFRVLNAKDYLNFRLTGRMATEPSDAGGTLLYDALAGQWSGFLLDACGVDGDMMPELVPSCGVVGELTRAAAEAMGLRPGIPVAAGGGDGCCAGVGAGSIAPGLSYNYLGSTSWIATTTAAPLYDPMQRTFFFPHVVPGLYHIFGAMQTAAASYAWLRREICRAEEAEAVKAGKSPYEVMDEIAAASPPGANGLMYLPYLLGERTPRWNPLARGGFVGMTMASGRGDVVRAVLEGVAMNLEIIISIFRDAGQAVDKLVLIGGGAKSPLWRRIMADIYGAEILMPNHLEEATAIGAAMLAGIGAGIFPGFETAERFSRLVDSTRPNPETRDMYLARKRLFDKLYYALEPVFPEFVK